MKRKRPLSPEEKALWDKVAARTDPLSKRPKPVAEPAKKPAPAVRNGAATPSPVKPFKLGEKVDHRSDHDLVASVSRQLRDAPLRMDARQHGRMKRGKLSPDDRLDLHGMTLAEAHPALISFILSAHANGCRLVLVITGKGKDRDDGGPIPMRHGRLRHEVPGWLSRPPLAPVVLQVTEAHRSHGGGGALYVYLRRAR